MGFSSKPSNYQYLKKLRKSKRVELKPCRFLKPDVRLRGYQSIGCLHLLSLSRMVLGDSVGLGKTLSAISAYSYLLEQDPEIKLLVICPKSAADQWAEEFEKFTSGITVHVLTNYYGKKKHREEYGNYAELKRKGVKCKKIYGFEARKAQYDTVCDNVFIMNYHAMQDDYRFIVENRGPKYIVIFDEAQAFKSEKTKTFFGADFIAEKAVRVYGLSATIIKNRLEEAYNIYRVVVPGLFPGKNTFLKTYTNRKKMAVWRKGRKRKRYFNKIVGYKNLNQFKDLIDPYFLIRRTREVADELPQLVSRKLVLEMSTPQNKLYKQALSGELYRRIVKDKYFEFEAFIKSKPEPTEKELKIFEKLKDRYDESLTEEGLMKNKLAALSYCQLVSNGPGWIREEGESSKETEFRRLFEQELMKEKVIVFTRFKSGIPRLENILDELEMKHVSITGSHDSEQRASARKTFQDPESDTDIIFITYAGSAALNLQAANVILFYDTPWSYGDLYQTIGRAQRIGSLYDHIYLLHMVNQKSIDEHVLEILDSKKELIGQIMGDIAEGAIEFKEDTLELKDQEGAIDALFSSVFGRKAS